MKIVQTILDKHIPETFEITVNQAGFVKNLDTTEATWLLMEKEREKHCPFSIAFLDLEHAFDRLCQYLASEELACWVKLLHCDLKRTIQKVAGISKPLPVSVGGR